jgi:glycosyltransferase involved in cell wall biosynthesis
LNASKHMNIAIFSDNFHPEISGIVDSITTTAKALATRGHRVRFCVPRYSKQNYDTVGLPVAELDLGPNISVDRRWSISVPTGNNQGRFAPPTGQYWKVLKDFKPDILHTQLFAGVGLEALHTAKKLGVPLLGTNHTAISEFVKVAPIHGPLVEKLVLRYVSWYYNHCALVTGPSNSVFTEMLEHKFTRPHQVLSNPIDTETFTPAASPEERAALQKEFKFSGHTVVYAGRLAEEKSIDVIVRAIGLARQKVPDITFALAGHGKSRAPLETLAKKCGADGALRFMGTLDKPTLAKFYKAGNVFAITSTSETQSMVLMQAMACGIPVVGVRARALPEYINQDNGFVVEPGDHTTLATRCMELLANPTLSQKLGVGGRVTAEQYSIAHIAERWEEIYNSAIIKART